MKLLTAWFVPTSPIIYLLIIKQPQIGIYSPISLVVGTRGRSLAGVHGLLSGSVSQYCLQNSPIPVVVVRPQHLRQQKMEKRLADPNRQGYSAILEQSNVVGSKAFENLVGHGVVEASDHEAEAVAKAIGLPGHFGKWKGFKMGEGPDSSGYEGDESEGATFSMAASTKSGIESEDDSPSPTGPMIIESTFEDMPNENPGMGSANGSGEEESFEQVEGMGVLSMSETEESVASKGKEKEV